MRWYSTNYLKQALGNLPPSGVQIKPTLSRGSRGPNNTPIPRKIAKLAKLYPKSVASLVITPNVLTDKFRGEHPAPSGQLLSRSQTIFNNGKPRLEWTLANYNDIPDVKALKNPPKLLPEVLFLGHTNTGKLSLINNLLVNRMEGKTAGGKTEYAYVSSRAGYTKTMNCFNIGDKLRLIDSPGYGEFGQEEQGKMVVEYIERRKVLRRAYLLIDSSVGFVDEDMQILDLLVQEGIPFEVVFTKVDLVISKILKHHNVTGKPVTDLIARKKNYELVIQANELVVQYFTNIIDQAGLLTLPSLPKLLFNNAHSAKVVPKRYGYKEIRATIIECCIPNSY